jgi:hypothetical protein
MKINIFFKWENKFDHYLKKIFANNVKTHFEKINSLTY